MSNAPQVISIYEVEHVTSQIDYPKLRWMAQHLAGWVDPSANIKDLTRVVRDSMMKREMSIEELRQVLESRELQREFLRDLNSLERQQQTPICRTW